MTSVLERKADRINNVRNFLAQQYRFYVFEKEQHGPLGGLVRMPVHGERVRMQEEQMKEVVCSEMVRLSHSPQSSLNESLKEELYSLGGEDDIHSSQLYAKLKDFSDKLLSTDPQETREKLLNGLLDVYDCRMYESYFSESSERAVKDTWCFLLKEHPSLYAYRDEFSEQMPFQLPHSYNLEDVNKASSQFIANAVKHALESQKVPSELIAREIIRSSNSLQSDYLDSMLVKYPSLIESVQPIDITEDRLQKVYEGVKQHEGKGMNILLKYVQNKNQAKQFLLEEISKGRVYPIPNILLNQDRKPELSFIKELIDANPIGAMICIPRDAQTDEYRLMAVAKDPEALKFIDDESFKRKYFSIRDTRNIQFGKPMEAAVAETIRQKANDSVSGKVQKENSHSAEKRNVHLSSASQREIPQMETLEDWKNFMKSLEQQASHAPADFSEVAAWHYNDSVKENEETDTYCFYDDADGSLDYSKSTQKFIYTSRDGRITEDFTKDMRQLQMDRVRWGSYNEAQCRQFLSRHNMQVLDTDGYAHDYISQKGFGGEYSYISRNATKLLANVTGHIKGAVVGRIRQQMSEAWGAGNI